MEEIQETYEAQKRLCEVPKNIADVLKDVKYAIAAKRKEDGFDFSSPDQHRGELSPYNGGSHYFNYHQNQQVERILERYRDMHHGKIPVPHNIDKVVESIAHIGRLTGTCRSDSRGIRDTIKSENSRLLNIVTHLVINESVLLDFKVDQIVKKPLASSKQCSKAVTSTPAGSLKSSKVKSSCSSIRSVSSAPSIASYNVQ